MVKQNATVLLEDARIGFRNFSGKEGPYNRSGDRNFTLFLEPDIAKAMEEDGWNIRYLTPRDEGDIPQALLEVRVHYSGSRPPRVVLITSRGQTTLDENSISILDWAEIRLVDMIIRPYHWEINGKGGIKAYLKTMYVTIDEDELEMRYGIPMDEDEDERMEKDIGIPGI